MNNLEAWNIIRNKFMDGGMGVINYNDPCQYVLSGDDEFYDGKSLLMSGEFDAKELRAIGWYLDAPEDFAYLREWTDGKEETEVLSSS